MRYAISSTPREKSPTHPALFRYPSLSRQISAPQTPSFDQKLKDLNKKDKERLRSMIRSLTSPAQDGKTPTPEELLALIIPLVPKNRKMVPIYNDSALIARVQELEEAIKEHKNFSKNIQASFNEYRSRSKMNHGGGLSNKNYSDNETPSGSGTTFTLAHAPSPAASLQLYRGGSLQAAGGVDFTLSSDTITLGTTLSVGEVLRASYRY